MHIKIMFSFWHTDQIYFIACYKEILRAILDTLTYPKDIDD